MSPGSDEDTFEFYNIGVNSLSISQTKLTLRTTKTFDVQGTLRIDGVTTTANPVDIQRGGVSIAKFRSGKDFEICDGSTSGLRLRSVPQQGVIATIGTVTSNGNNYGTSQTYSGVASTGEFGGTGATFNVVTDGSGGISSVAIATGGTGYETNHLRIGPINSNTLTRPAFMYQDIRVSNNNIDSSQIHIPYLREGLPKPVANIVYGGAEPDANNVVFLMVPGDYVVNGDGSGNHIGSDAVISTASTNRMRNFGWNANFNGDQATQLNNSQYTNMAKIKDDTPGPAIAQGKYSHFSLDFDHSNSTAGLNGKKGEYLEIYDNSYHRYHATGQDHTQSKWMWANTTHSNYNPFRIASIAEVTANPDLYMSSDFTIEMWLLRDFAEASDPSTDTYNGEYDAIIGSSDSSGFTLSISNWSRRQNVVSPAYSNTQGWRVHNHGNVRIMNGTTHINTWSYQATLGQQPTYGNYIDGNHPGGGIPEKEWFHLAIVRLSLIHISEPTRPY